MSDLHNGMPASAYRIPLPGATPERPGVLIGASSDWFRQVREDSEAFHELMNREMHEMTLDLAASLGWGGVGRRHGPPKPRMVWVIPEDPPLDLSADAVPLWLALKDIAGDGSGAGDYYVGDMVTMACEAIGHQEVRPG